MKNSMLMFSAVAEAAVGAGSVAVLTDKAVPDQATPEHAEQLGELRTALVDAQKLAVKTLKTYREYVAIGGNINNVAEVEDLRTKAERANSAYLIKLAETRADIDELPTNTRARGGANRQSVVVECFGRVDINLGKVMSPQDAAKMNKAAWAA